MENKVFRVFVEKKKGFDVEASQLLRDMRENLSINSLGGVRIINRYDISGIDEDIYERAKKTILSEPPVDNVYDDNFEKGHHDRFFAVEYLPGQYDQRADSTAQCIEILSQKERPLVRAARVYVLNGVVSDDEYERIKSYCINPVDSREAAADKPKSLEMENIEVSKVPIIKGFIDLDEEGAKAFIEEKGLAMTAKDVLFCRDYFRDTEKRDPSETEIRVIDTYWSDHCRHTTFLTEIDNVDFGEGKLNSAVKDAYESYLSTREKVYGQTDRSICLMDMATLAMKELRKEGKLQDLEVSGEINACSIVIDVDVNGKNEKYLLMFKNETHNHPTEIEPFGGAATCLGGAIRDPLSGRAYVYQAMRVTGCADPRKKLEETLKGKLPQRKITLEAAHGYSSYGNQIGLATGQVSEVYDEGYAAKRMEIGAVIAAVPQKNVRREVPEKGDVIILLGGRTGRDGCGGATGSSKEHNEESLEKCGAEVQKGNAPTERKLQRLFRSPEVTLLIKRCNDFGAGGVSVAIGELADGLVINLDKVLKKYEGLDGTELAISESQERMAVVVAKKDAEEFIRLSEEENLEAVIAAEVTENRRLRMNWLGETIVDISRDFLDTNGAKQNTDIKVNNIDEEGNFLKPWIKSKSVHEGWADLLSDLNICSQKGLAERFDASIGGATVLMPFGGKYEITPAEGMSAKIPIMNGNTETASCMTYGFSPRISKWSPFHGGVYAVIESLTKLAAMGSSIEGARLTFQEYFEKPNGEPERWGKPFSALLGAFTAQRELETPAIGGKDSMSGTFRDLDVPPTLVSFAVNAEKAKNIISPEFKAAGNELILIQCPIGDDFLPDFKEYRKAMASAEKLIKEGKAVSAFAVRLGGISEAVLKMCLGNRIGFEFNKELTQEMLFKPLYGSIVLEIDSKNNDLSGIECIKVGNTINDKIVRYKNSAISIEEALESYTVPLDKVFRLKTEDQEKSYEIPAFKIRNGSSPLIKTVKPKVFIPVFPGTNCEYDTQRSFIRAGGETSVKVFRNNTAAGISDSIDEFVKEIKSSNIIMISGGFSAGDEPDGSGKFISTVFRNPYISEAVMDLLKNRDGLMLGICNGFQALIKLGLLPYGEITDMKETSPTLTYNSVGRHFSGMVRTKVVSVLSPWFSLSKVGDIHTIAASHGEGRFAEGKGIINSLIKNGQIATQYVDLNGNATSDMPYNPNGSDYAIEGITSPDGRVLGKMAHSERIDDDIYRNIHGDTNQRIFEAGINYFK